MQVRAWSDRPGSARAIAESWENIMPDSMQWLILARVVHVLAIVIWIGGVALVTLVLLPSVRSFKSPQEAVAFFEAVEGRFARIARIATIAAALSGFWLVHGLNAWGRFADPHYWWMHAMVGVWILFSLMLFVLEPLWLHRWFRRRTIDDPAGTLGLIGRLHWLLLVISLITVAGAVAGAHGWG